jgi:leucyl aminopeptidase
MQINVQTKKSTLHTTLFFKTKDEKLPSLSREEFKGDFLNIITLRPNAKAREIYIGLGEASQISPIRMRQAAGAGIKTALSLGLDQVAINAVGYAGHLQSITEGALLANYRFDRFKTQKKNYDNTKSASHRLRQLDFIIEKQHLQRAKIEADRGRILAEACNFTRELGNLPGNIINPVTLADEARKLSKRLSSLKVHIRDEKALQREGFGGILAVGKGSSVPPRMIEIHYQGGKRSEAPVVIIGKGITFDSGGISIKPGDRMDEMKFDKMGACAVLGIMQAVASLKLKKNIIGLIAAAENMPGPGAYRPGDILETYDGQTIEVLNTDAEGRIILADVLAYARETFQPALMIDMATLTGACIIALGPKRAGLFTEDRALRDQLQIIGEETGDRLWPLPLGEEFDEMIRSDIATVKNIGGREGGACTGASFLKTWAGNVPWAHIDIAGPAWITKEEKFLEKGATGFGVRLITEYLRQRE